MKDLENEKAELLQKKGAGAVGGVISNAIGGGKGLRSSIGAGNSPKKQNQTIDDSKANEDLINFLEHKLEEIEKKLSTTQNEYEQLQNEYMEMQEKLN